MISSSPQLELHLAHIKDQFKKREKLHIITGEEFLRHTSLNPFGRKALQILSSSRIDYLISNFRESDNVLNVNICDFKDSLPNDLKVSVDSLKKQIGHTKVEDVIRDLETSVLSGIASYTRVTSTKYLIELIRLFFSEKSEIILIFPSGNFALN